MFFAFRLKFLAHPENYFLKAIKIKRKEQLFYTND